MLSRLFVVVLAALAAAACSVRVETPFDAKEAAFIHRKGTGSISGEVFLTREFARVVRGAGERVYLIPATAYTLERFNTLFRNAPMARWAPDIEDTPDDYHGFRRETKADSRGQFSFGKVAAGRYIVASRVFWTEPYLPIPKGAAVWDTVTVEEGEDSKVILSGR
jgi:hypothetical protein